jgi:hypothetical protein
MRRANWGLLVKNLIPTNTLRVAINNEVVAQCEKIFRHPLIFLRTTFAIYSVNILRLVSIAACKLHRALGMHPIRQQLMFSQ